LDLPLQPAAELIAGRLADETDGRHQEVVAHLPVACCFGFVSMSGDARRLVCAVHRLEPDLWLVSNFGPGN
jgi:hypothetical protein